MHYFLKFILEWNSTCFGKSLSPSSGVIHYALTNGICHTSLYTDFEQNKFGITWSSSKIVYKFVRHIPFLSLEWKTPDDWQRNCAKHVDFHC